MSVRVIRSGDAAHAAPTTRATRARFEATARRIDAEKWNARVEGEAIIAEAKKQAASIVEEAEKRADRVREGARAEGIEQGHREALATIAKVRAMATLSAEEASDVINSAARAVAERAIGQQISVDDAALAGWTREALASLHGARRIVVRGPTRTIDRLRAHVQQIAPRGAGMLELVVDPAIAEGTLVARSELGEVHVEVKTQVAAILETIEEAMAAATRGRRG